jgi:choline dehydrogenase
MMRMLPAMALPEDVHREGTAPRAMRSAIAGLFDIKATKRFVDRLFGIVVILGKPESRGSVKITTAEPTRPARIDPAYLAVASDRAAMLEGMKRARTMARADALVEIGSREILPGLMGRGERATSAFLTQNIMTTYHYAGTCKMGDDPSRGAVVDRSLSVHGVQGLTIADASIIPEAPVAALNAPSMLIALRASKMILEATR